MIALENIKHLMRGTYEQVQGKSEILVQNNDFIRVNKIILDRDKDKGTYKQLFTGTHQWMSSCKQIKTPISFVMGNDAIKNELYIAYSNMNQEQEQKLKAAYPDIVCSNMVLEDVNEFTYHKFITGIPFVDEKELKELKYDAFIRRIKREIVQLKINFIPVPTRNIEQIYEELVKERTRISGEIEKDESLSEASTESNAYQDGVSENTSDGASAIVYSKQEAITKTSNNTYTSGISKTETLGRKVTDHSYNLYDEALEIQIQRVEHMLKHGAFETSIILYAKNKDALTVAEEAFRSIFINDFIEPLRSHEYTTEVYPLQVFKSVKNSNSKHLLYGAIPEYMNLYTTKELAWLITPYAESVNGFTIVRKPRFLQQASNKGDIYLGNLLDYTKDTGNKVCLEEQDINKHILVAGMTGTGKTNTVFSLLNSTQVPFLVIEPAKAEYRILKTLVPQLRVYTLGREHVSPFRMNPFKFDYKKISLQEHIDNLKVIFTSAFTMYASMPNILEQCLINIYTQKGWSLLNSKNVLCEEEVKEYFYPTLEDLYVEIDHYIDALGYAQEQNQNIRAALLTRIKSLMTGTKGFMLNTTASIKMEELLKYPTVLELEGIADDTEKSLMIGFIMLNIYEHVKANFEGYTGKLKHTIVIEEAHRLFANVSSSDNQEQVNTRGKAVEALSNMLCEIRAYGEGFIIVDQVPTKLAPDVLKNTNTKIIHRLVSKDDCDYIAKAIQIEEEDIGFITQLKVGQALVYNEKLEETAHVKINFNKDQYDYFIDNQIKVLAKAYNSALEEQVTAHPIVETLFNYPETKDSIIDIARKYIRGLQQEAELTSLYNEIKKEYIQLAVKNGFVLKEYYDEYVIEMMYKAVMVLLSQSKLTNNVYQKYRYLAIIKCGLELGMKQEFIKEKQVRLFRIVCKQYVLMSI